MPASNQERPPRSSRGIVLARSAFKWSCQSVLPMIQTILSKYSGAPIIRDHYLIITQTACSLWMDTKEEDRGRRCSTLINDARRCASGSPSFKAPAPLFCLDHLPNSFIYLLTVSLPAQGIFPHPLGMLSKKKKNQTSKDGDDQPGSTFVVRTWAPSGPNFLSILLHHSSMNA